jgi:histidinol-phosphate/aromatic aminotransferase/cobyric acid decarboxylase-like protein
MNEILAMMQRLGYSVADATVSEWVDRSVESMVLGALGAGGSAQAVAKNPVVTLAAAIAGAFAARWVESELRRLEVMYRLVPSSTGWVLTPVSETERQQELAGAAA